MRNILLMGILGCAISVILGAFGAHAFKDVFSSSDLQTFQTATRYLFLHSLGLILIVLLSFHFPEVNCISPVILLIGIILFSGSLYLYLLLKIRWMVFITPLGGLSLIMGWLTLFIQILKVRKVD